ncbi:MAG: hypothetical protein A2599_00495 [Candidatus Staskawiczbacteria bacterium RIFOXYD1_FULL_39_28]|uniref:TrbC/VIRB2 family protein n=1 Tax=Candidatus Staskawiczbacteria bacterium RIFOXYC1_FULL_38_18 TaxID=1802229 RepID=A0A1G2JEQ5_9BACT|nr:MAG: hypothetical protein A2401_02100 [Candidatus Staskawiczbacteria bacterium RIFOXYC1_FULL_38_18]OGZ90850.1 MAG: hypothetical protein A2599_00495 [Candidatus Staskawiczbacteria bacterium RIFOXYD1_FULL_39_28]
MKKSLLIGSFLLLFLIPVLASAQGIVPCNGPDCDICSFFEMLSNIYDFIVKFIAAPLAVLMLTIGGIMILISAGNPNLSGIGKKILWAAIIGLVLVFCSYLIIDTILKAIGYTQGINFACS